MVDGWSTGSRSTSSYGLPEDGLETAFLDALPRVRCLEVDLDLEIAALAEPLRLTWQRYELPISPTTDREPEAGMKHLSVCRAERVGHGHSDHSADQGHDSTPSSRKLDRLGFSREDGLAHGEIG